VTHAPPEVMRAHFPGQPDSARAARHLLRSHVATILSGEDVDTAMLLVSEVVTNAVVHAGTSVEVVVCLQGGATLRVEVADGSVQRPTIRHDAMMASTGRGLHLLDALAHRWGVTVRATGKTVWFELSGAETWTEESVMKSSLQPKFTGMVWIDGVQVPVNLDAASWDEAIALLNNQYGHDSAFVLRTADATMQPG